jgi:hypothetical protein
MATLAVMRQLLEINPAFSLDFIERTYMPSEGREVFLTGLRLACASDRHR